MPLHLTLLASVAFALSTPLWAADPATRGGPAPSASPAGAAAPRPAIERQDIRAQLTPRRYTTIASEIGAKINRISVAEGGSFRAGQSLVSFDCSVQQAQFRKVEAEVDAAEQTLSANVQLEKLNSVGQLELDLSRSSVSRAKAEASAHRALLSKCSIAAPFAGRVAEQRVREQQYVQPGQPLLDILDDSVLELEFLVPSRWLSTLKTGSRLQVSIDETGKTYPARYIRIGARVDPVSQTVKVAAAIDGRFPELIAGMTGRIDASLADAR